MKGLVSSVTGERVLEAFYSEPCVVSSQEAVIVILARRSSPCGQKKRDATTSRSRYIADITNTQNTCITTIDEYLFTCIVHALQLTVKAFLGTFSWHNLHFTGRVGHEGR